MYLHNWNAPILVARQKFRASCECPLKPLPGGTATAGSAPFVDALAARVACPVSVGAEKIDAKVERDSFFGALQPIFGNKNRSQSYDFWIYSYNASVVVG
jgi:hypothetical protein